VAAEAGVVAADAAAMETTRPRRRFGLFGRRRATTAAAERPVAEDRAVAQDRTVAEDRSVAADRSAVD
jgi:hypothetical protein